MRIDELKNAFTKRISVDGELLSISEITLTRSGWEIRTPNKKIELSEMELTKLLNGETIYSSLFFKKTIIRICDTK